MKRLLLLICAGITAAGASAAFTDVKAMEKLSPLTYAASTAETEVLEYFDAKVEKPGTLADVLGDKVGCIDSLVVEGTINASDFSTLWKATALGATTVINLEKAITEEARIPDNAFWHPDEMYDPDNDVIYSIALRRIIFNDYTSVIGTKAFYGALNLEEINMTTTMRIIGPGAFELCKRLKSPITFPVGMDEIGDAAFRNCIDLEEVHFGSLVRIGKSAFALSGLKKFDTELEIGSIDTDAFHHTALENVDASRIGKFDGMMNFSMNQNMKTLVLPQGITTIPVQFAYMCMALESLDIPASVESIGEGAFSYCESMQKLTLHEGLRSIGEEAFLCGYSLTMIDLPATVERLDDCCFAGCKNVEAIYSRAAVPPTCAPQAFGGKNSIASAISSDIPVYVPVGSADLYRNAAGWNNFTDFVETEYFPAGTDDIAADASAAIVSGGAGELLIAAAGGTAYAVYTPSGACVAAGTLAGNRVAVALPAGVYVVRAGSSAVRTVVR